MEKSLPVSQREGGSFWFKSLHYILAVININASLWRCTRKCCISSVSIEKRSRAKFHSKTSTFNSVSLPVCAANPPFSLRNPYSCRKRAATGGPGTPPPLLYTTPHTTTRDPWWWTLVKRHCSIEPASALHFNELMGEHGQLHTRHLLNRGRKKKRGLKKIHFMLRGCLKSPI